MKKMVFFSLLGVFVLLTAWFRLAPSALSKWHVAVTVVEGEEIQTGGILIRSKNFDVEPQDLLNRFQEVALENPRTRVLAGNAEEGRITFISRSLVWGFPDYTTVEVKTDGEDSYLLIHGRLRFGRSDLGVNAKRVKGWLAAL